MQQQQITKPQLSKLHVLFSQLGITEVKGAVIHSITEGRTISSKELTLNEARYLISLLSAYNPCDKMRSKVYALAYEAELIYGCTDEDKRMNTAKLNKFLIEKGSVKKELGKMTHAELVKTVNQFQQIVKHTSESTASKATKSLLDELNLKSSLKRPLKQL